MTDTKIYFGCDELERGWEHYFTLCNAFEVVPPANPATRPTLKTLNSWRVKSPRGFCFVLHAEPAVVDAAVSAYERDDPTIGDALRAAWAETEERAHALAAKAILLPTPPEFRPSTPSREFLRNVAEELAAETSRRVIWEPSGLWDTTTSRDFAESIGLAYALDPFIAEQEDVGFTHGDACFRVTERAAMRRSFEAYEFERMLSMAEPYDRVFTLLSGRFKFRHLRELSQLVEH